MERGYIALWRKSIDSQIFQNEGLWKLWCWCLMKANHKEIWVQVEGSLEAIKVMPGQFITGRFSLHKEYYPRKIKKQKTPLTLWRWLQKLENMQNLNIKTNNKYSIISILNWDTYQRVKQQNEQQNEQQMNNRRTTDEQQMNTNNNVYNVNNKKITSFKKNEGQKKEDSYLTKKKKKLSGKRLETFLQFWDTFDYKFGKAEAADAWLDIPKLTNDIVSKIIAAARVEAQNRPASRASGNTPKMGQGWLSGRRWEDEPSQPKIYKPTIEELIS